MAGLYGGFPRSQQSFVNSPAVNIPPRGRAFRLAKRDAQGIIGFTTMERL
jgi:hypothetical protein